MAATPIESVIARLLADLRLVVLLAVALLLLLLSITLRWPTNRVVLTIDTGAVTLALPEDSVDAYWLVYPDALHDWPPLQALRNWLLGQLEQSQRAWAAADASPLKSPAGTTAASRTGNRSRARSATRATGRGR